MLKLCLLALCLTYQGASKRVSSKGETCIMAIKDGEHPYSQSSTFNFQLEENDLWYYDLKGKVCCITIKGLRTIKVWFDEQGHIIEGTEDGEQITYERNAEDRIVSSHSKFGFCHDTSNTSYRQRATDSHGNWTARKLQFYSPYWTIATELCYISYYK